MAATQALSTEIGIQPACDAFDIARSGFYRGQGPAKEPSPRPSPPRTLSPEERQAVLATLHSDRFVDTAPATVYATLLDEGRYHCSIRTFYRILKEQAEGTARRNQLRHPVSPKPELLATAPTQGWSWDLTTLLGPVQWSYCYLAVILDLFSRYVVGWMIAPAESAGLAQRRIKDPCEQPQIGTGQWTLQADRGSSRTAKPGAWWLADLGVTTTHSRPSIRDDNPFSEAQFKTLTYRPDFPERVGSLEDARIFCQPCCSWYNGEQRPSGIGLMPPAAGHDERAETMRAARQQGLLSAYAAHPARFVRKPPQPPILPHAVWMNPPKEPSASQEGAGATLSTADDQRAARNVEGLGIVSETVVVSPHAIMTSTDEVLH